MKPLIFGINGHDGYCLKQACEQKQIEVVGVSKSNGKWMDSVRDWNFVERITRTLQPNFAFHLAASYTICHDARFQNYDTISKDSLNILEAVKRHCPNTKVFTMGSGVQFKYAGYLFHHEIPIRKTKA